MKAIKVVISSFILASLYYGILMYNIFSQRDADVSTLTSDYIISRRMVTPKVLIYIATHMPDHHKEYLKHCWPLALKNSYLLNTSDVAFYLTPDREDIDESVRIIKKTFKNQNLAYHIKPNLGYQKGAMAALTQASKGGWFDAYDWVFRINPDVIIQNDTWMLHTIENDANASLLYIDCVNRPSSKFYKPKLLHTDFFALKIKALRKGDLHKFRKTATMLDTRKETAETMFTTKMRSVIVKKQHRHLPDAYPLKYGICRVNGNRDGAVFHFQSVNLQNGICPAKFM